MNERYLFRGKRISDNTWVEGYYISFEYEYIGGDSPESKIGHFIFPLNSKEEEMHIPVHPETVGMWSGITDKNGVKIFEVDTIQISDLENTTGIIVFDEASFKMKDGVYYSNLSAYPRILINVIGNIHDNDKAVNP